MQECMSNVPVYLHSTLQEPNKGCDEELLYGQAQFLCCNRMHNVGHIDFFEAGRFGDPFGQTETLAKDSLTSIQLLFQ